MLIDVVASPESSMQIHTSRVAIAVPDGQMECFIAHPEGAGPFAPVNAI
jgi:hypothetical protein